MFISQVAKGVVPPYLRTGIEWIWKDLSKEKDIQVRVKPKDEFGLVL